VDSALAEYSNVEDNLENEWMNLGRMGNERKSALQQI
jgi:hypothetical protein